MVERGIRWAICHSINSYGKANKKYMKEYDKNKESPYLKYWDINNLHGWVMSQNLSVNDFEWVADISEFNEDVISKTNESDEGYFLEVDV